MNVDNKRTSEILRERKRSLKVDDVNRIELNVLESVCLPVVHNIIKTIEFYVEQAYTYKNNVAATSVEIKKTEHV